jgi:hypothetical protein
MQFFVYLSAELNSQWPITELAAIQTKEIRKQRTKKQQNNKTNKNGSAKAF